MSRFTSRGYSSSDTSGQSSDDDDDASSPTFKKRKRSSSTYSLSSPSKTDRLLCTISSHSGSVLTLRFSTSATILASASDDSHVLLYAKSTSSSPMLRGNLTNQAENIEHWNRIRICRGHNLDVVGLAWAPDDSHLISCSLDSDAPICVWRLNFDGSNDGPSPHTRMTRDAGSAAMDMQGRNMKSIILQPDKILGVKEHTSTVKGVTFDPAGKYIASSGDDPSLCIWRAFDDWGLESRIDASSGIFQQEGGSSGGSSSAAAAAEISSLANLSMFRRISFAPDGTHVCATNAMLRKKNIAAMVSRDGWGVSAGGGGASGSVSGGGGEKNVAGAVNLIGHKQHNYNNRGSMLLWM